MQYARISEEQSRLSRVWICALSAGLVLGGCAVAAPFDDPGLIVDADSGAADASPQGSNGGSTPQSADAATGDDATQGGGADAARPPPADAGTDSQGSPPDASPSAPKPAPGEVLISELLYDPSGSEPDQEWLELYNAASSPRLLSGLILQDGADRTHTIGGVPPLIIAAGSYVVLARNTSAAVAAKVPAAAIVYEYGTGLAPSAGIILANGSTGGLVLLDGATQIAQAHYASWYNQSSPGGHSLELKGTTAGQEGNAAGWCLAANAWTSGSDRGTPGAATDCP